MSTAAQNQHLGRLELPGRVLRGLRILNIAYGVGVGVLLIVSAVAPAFLFHALGVRPGAPATTMMSMRGIMVVGIIGAVIAQRILRELLRIVASVGEGDPFVSVNAVRLRAIAWLVFVTQLLHMVVWVLFRLASTAVQPIRMDWSFSFAPWVAVLLLFVLARVFEHGAQMREDIQGTV